ncbi:T7SS effector LXG polymorphic toxin [Carnobacterium maltaromaticum]|uniref:T7SS effector LXG polymorphic toxin n=1 Tax=Carnobacterium maltaromaticum TaxID=2751 RepID=UPI00026C8DB1|nr:T7SS effector LXG polymorphic toxin [Carnobacterium maltaromaticum]
MTKMDIGEYKHLLDQMKELKLTLGVSFTGTNGTIEEFSEDSKLKGVAWSSTKSYFSVGYTPMLDGLSDIFYTAITTLENFIRAFESEVTTSGVKLDLDHLQDLQRRRDELQREKTNWLHQIAEQASKIPGLGHLFDDYSVLQAEKKVQLMEDFRDFIHRHDSDFSELNGLIEQVLLGLEELGKQRSFNGDKHGYSPINFMNLNWSKNLDSYHKKHGEEVKKIQKNDMENFKNMAEVAAGAAAMESFGANVALANMGPSLYSAGKNYYSGPGVKGGNSGKVNNEPTAPKKTTPMNNFKFSANAQNHLKDVEIVSTKKGVVGGHNMTEFNNALKNQGVDINDLIISKKQHPTIDGIYEVEYRIPRKDIAGNIAEPVSYKNIKQPKTIYDSSIISDEKMYLWGQEAMKNGTIDGRLVEGTASNGLKFRGYLNDVGEITNFFPIIK